MKAVIEKITVTIDASEANAIVNALRFGMKNHLEVTTKNQAAHDLVGLLQANFHSQVTGIHIPK